LEKSLTRVQEMIYAIHVGTLVTKIFRKINLIRACGQVALIIAFNKHI